MVYCSYSTVTAAGGILVDLIHRHGRLQSQLVIPMEFITVLYRFGPFLSEFGSDCLVIVDLKGILTSNSKKKNFHHHLGENPQCSVGIQLVVLMLEISRSLQILGLRSSAIMVVSKKAHGAVQIQIEGFRKFRCRWPVVRLLP